MEDQVTKQMLWDAIDEGNKEISEAIYALSKSFGHIDDYLDSEEIGFDKINRGFEEAREHREMLHKKTKALIQECADERWRRMTY